MHNCKQNFFEQFDDIDIIKMGKNIDYQSFRFLKPKKK